MAKNPPLTLTLTFRAFSRRIYPKRLTISTYDRRRFEVDLLKGKRPDSLVKATENTLHDLHFQCQLLSWLLLDLPEGLSTAYTRVVWLLLDPPEGLGVLPIHVLSGYY